MTSSSATERPSHRETLLREGLNQLFDHGYHGFTVDGLLDATGVPKGSFYHHFGSKQAFAVAILQRYWFFHQARLAKWAARENLSTSEVLVGYFRDIAQLFIDSGYRMTDLAGKLATEVSGADNPLHAQISRDVAEWRAQLEQILQAGQSRGDVRADRAASELSAAIHALLDGAFVVAASTRDTGFLDNLAVALRALLVGPE